MSVNINASIKVANRKSVINKDLWCYEDDKNINIFFTIEDDRYEIIDNIGRPNYYSFTIINPSGRQIDRDELIQVVDDGFVKFKINEKANEFNEIGKYKIQIHLYDTNTTNKSEFKIPEFDFEVVEKIKGKPNLIIDDSSQNILTEEQKSIRYNGEDVLGVKISEIPEINSYDGQGYTVLNYNESTYKINTNKMVNENIKNIDTDFINKLE